MCRWHAVRIAFRIALIGVALNFAVSVSSASAPLLEFEFNEGAGATSTDSVHQLIGVLGVHPEFVDDPKSVMSAPSGAAGDHCLSFNETNPDGEGFLALDDGDGLVLAPATNRLTIQAWVRRKLNETRPYQVLAAYGGLYRLALEDGSLVFSVKHIMADSWTETSAYGMTVPAGEWHQVAVVWELGLGVTFYLDGGSAMFRPDGMAVALPPPQHYLTIGADDFGADAFVGQIDRFRIDGAGLRPDQLDSVANSPKPTAASTRVAYDFDEPNPPFTSAVSPPRPLWPSSQFLPAITTPQFVSDTPSGNTGDYALQFGADQIVTASDPNTVIRLDPNDPSFTWQSWAKFGPQPRYLSAFFASYGPGGAISCFVTSDRHLGVNLRDYITSAAIIPDDAGWHHLAIVHENGEGLRFYVDGLLEDTIPYSDGVDFSQSGGNCFLGSDPENGLDYVGLLDRLRLTSGVLSPDQFDDARFPHYLVSVLPLPGALAANPDLIQVVVASEAAGLDTNSFMLSVDGAAVAATLSRDANNQTVIVYIQSPLFAPRSTHTATLNFQDIATPPNRYTRSWTFTVIDYPSLETGLGTKLGSGDSTQPGFRYRLVQTVSASATNFWSDTIAQAEMNLAGGMDPYRDREAFVYNYNANIPGFPAMLTYLAGEDGWVAITNVINFNHAALYYGGSGDTGDFRQPQYPDQPIPGVPVSKLSDDPAADYVTAEILTYAEFPQAGYYRIGVNSDYGFRVSSATNQDYPVKLVRINSPATMASNVFAIEAKFKPPLPQLADLGPITGNVVEADPLDGSGQLTNPAAVHGNIVLIDRGANTFAEKIRYAAEAGAAAVIISENHGPDDMIMEMGGGAQGLDIPAVMINFQSGHALHAALGAGQSVNVTLQSHHFTSLGETGVGGSRNDNMFGFAVPAAGVYPLRLLWFHGTGDAYCEWFSIEPNGSKSLLNDPGSPGALKTFRARAAVPLPPNNPILHVGLNGNILTFTWTGMGLKLQSTPTLSNPVWTDVINGENSPCTGQVSGPCKFYRLCSQ